MLAKKRDHWTYFLQNNGKKTNIFVQISLSKKTEYSDTLLSRVKRELRLISKSDFENFLSCVLNKEKYIALLINTNQI